LRRWLAWQAAALAASAALIWLVFAGARLDFAITNYFYDASSARFPLRGAWALAVLGHTGLKWLMVGACVVLAAMGLFRPAARRAALWTVLAAAVVALLKATSAHSCPWDLATYGGEGTWFPLFGSMPLDPGPGRCLPAGHPLTGFAFFGLYFALRTTSPRGARWALVAAWAVGLAAGAVQVARGAHFASHVLWTAWVCWAVCLALSVAWDWRKILRGG
jgi:membrane-associated PAP2 superfamily phosphatase